jgi:AbiJ N-terminal domain 4
VLCTVLRKVPDRNNWSAYPNIWEECQQLIGGAPWYRVYDFVEALYRQLVESHNPEGASKWAELINEYFIEAGVGWRLADGRLESRGAEGFESSVDAPRTALDAVGLLTAQGEIHEAMRDLSRRPEPDLTGAVQHAMAGLECTARQVAGDPRATLGEIINRQSDLLHSTMPWQKCGATLRKRDGTFEKVAHRSAQRSS